jgi:uncharacterized membrane protein
MKSAVLLLSVLFLSGCSQFSEPQGLSNKNQDPTANSANSQELEATFASIKTNILDKKCISCHSPDSTSEKGKELPMTTESEVMNGASDLGPLVVPGEPAKSVLYRAIVKDERIRGKVKVMPPEKPGHRPVTLSEQNVIAAWIAGVAKKEVPSEVKVNPPVGEPQPGQPVVTPVEPVVTPVEPVVTMPTPVPGGVNPPPVAVEPSVIDFAFIKSTILDKKCMECHKAGGKAEDLIFAETREEFLKITNTFNQAIIVPGKPEQSLLYISLVKDDEIRQDVRLMPPKNAVKAGKAQDITVAETELILKWISEGAK